MSAPAPKGYQREAVVNALEIFRYAESQFRQAGDDASRAAATAFNGCLLLEAPTGSGKTLMAGMIAETFAAPDRDGNAQIVWFWFTPFATLVEQAKGAIKSTFVGLRVRDLQGDRKTRGTKSGDVYVTTWASVAASNAATRKVRSGGEFVLSLDDLIDELRADGFRIGAVVDEAHHGFATAKEAVRFYRESLKPDFTLMVTATPDDADVKKFKKAAGIGICIASGSAAKTPWTRG
jgi:type III restriction enzyme